MLIRCDFGMSSPCSPSFSPSSVVTYDDNSRIWSKVPGLVNVTKNYGKSPCGKHKLFLWSFSVAMLTQPEGIGCGWFSFMILPENWAVVLNLRPPRQERTPPRCFKAAKIHKTLVGSGWWFQPTPLKNHDIPNWMESHKIPWFQATNQINVFTR